ncbi:unnamed protein product [Phytophthora lilii]|uniref:RxLR effector protein n=1 Tax=Phytophthora lilii TaxID=2077276 RepID=A0A9W6XNS3_9STRA|nr:unnamed protein product [Phytophthora lilii]
MASSKTDKEELALSTITKRIQLRWVLLVQNAAVNYTVWSSVLSPSLYPSADSNSDRSATPSTRGVNCTTFLGLKKILVESQTAFDPYDHFQICFPRHKHTSPPSTQVQETMRLSSVLLVAVAAILATLDTTSAANGVALSEPRTENAVNLADTHGIIGDVHRFLRTRKEEDAVVEDSDDATADEERG